MTNLEIAKDNINKKTHQNNIKIFTKEEIDQFNSFKYKHFNNFFHNIINEQLKFHHKNDLQNNNDNKEDIIIKNESLNKTLNQNLLLKNKNRNQINFEYINNSNFNNVKNKFLNKAKSKENKIINQNANHNFKNESNIFPNIKSKYINNGQNTILNIFQNQKVKPNIKINSRNISFIENEYISKSINDDNKKYYKTSEFNFIYKNKNQQLPKDVINNLLLFLKKNKKHLERTSKYYNIYKDYKNFIEDKNESSINNESKNSKLNNKNINKGYYGRKAIDGVELYDTTSTYRYKYSNKSEKNRLELILAELNKLKGYVEKNKNEKELFIKDFLSKHNININYDDTNKLILFENFLKNLNKNQNDILLKPYLGIKEMILNIFEEGDKLDINDTFNKSNEMKNFSNSQSTFNMKYSSNIINNKSKFDPYGANPNKSNSPLIISQKYINLKEENRNINKNKTINNDIHKNIKNIKKFDLYDTNSYLKQIEKQTRIHCPIKNYSSNYNLIIKEIGNELEKLTNNIRTENKNKYQAQPLIIKDKKTHINNFNCHFLTQTLNKSIDDIFITSNKSISPTNIILGKNEVGSINTYKNNNCKNKMKIIKRSKKISMNENKGIKKNEKKMNQISLKALNTKPKIKGIEIEDVKKRLKLTEYIVYNNAKRRKMFEDIGKNELYECVNNLINNQI